MTGADSLSSEMEPLVVIWTTERHVQILEISGPEVRKGTLVQRVSINWITSTFMIHRLTHGERVVVPVPCMHIQKLFRQEIISGATTVYFCEIAQHKFL